MTFPWRLCVAVLVGPSLVRMLYHYNWGPKPGRREPSRGIHVHNGDDITLPVGPALIRAVELYAEAVFADPGSVLVDLYGAESMGQEWADLEQGRDLVSRLAESAQQFCHAVDAGVEEAVLPPPPPGHDSGYWSRREPVSATRREPTHLWSAAGQQQPGPDEYGGVVDDALRQTLQHATRHASTSLCRRFYARTWRILAGSDIPMADGDGGGGGDGDDEEEEQDEDAGEVTQALYWRAAQLSQHLVGPLPWGILTGHLLSLLGPSALGGLDDPWRTAAAGPPITTRRGAEEEARERRRWWQTGSYGLDHSHDADKLAGEILGYVDTDVYSASRMAEGERFLSDSQLTALWYPSFTYSAAEARQVLPPGRGCQGRLSCTLYLVRQSVGSVCEALQHELVVPFRDDFVPAAHHLLDGMAVAINQTRRKERTAQQQPDAALWAEARARSARLALQEVEDIASLPWGADCARTLRLLGQAEKVLARVALDVGTSQQVGWYYSYTLRPAGRAGNETGPQQDEVDLPPWAEIDAATIITNNLIYLPSRRMIATAARYAHGMLARRSEFYFYRFQREL
ncbi:hypothetical protein UCDDA912_g10315 [Diaporthe ampelina]|uniref:Uncharacterized protein n=1 Tax=Diaporthe ampelina TaxID=1214573 RepID=A0A0G2F696_9PEZI|nr:hypothetical protein UCDDA912_g10315 [Diaporthe ampelina]